MKQGNTRGEQHGSTTVQRSYLGTVPFLCLSRYDMPFVMLSKHTVLLLLLFRHIVPIVLLSRQTSHFYSNINATRSVSFGLNTLSSVVYFVWYCTFCVARLSAQQLLVPTVLTISRAIGLGGTGRRLHEGTAVSIRDSCAYTNSPCTPPPWPLLSKAQLYVCLIRNVSTIQPKRTDLATVGHN